MAEQEAVKRERRQVKNDINTRIAGQLRCRRVQGKDRRKCGALLRSQSGQRIDGAAGSQVQPLLAIALRFSMVEVDQELTDVTFCTASKAAC